LFISVVIHDSMNVGDPTFQCQYCTLVCNSVKSLISHYRVRHALYESSALCLKCTNNKCPTICYSYSGFRRHLKRCFFISNRSIRNNSPEIEIEPFPNLITASCSVPLTDAEGVVELDKHTENVLKNEPIKNLATSYLLQLTGLGLPNSTIDKVLNSTTELVEHVSDNLETFIENHCPSLNPREKTLLLDQLNAYKTPFDGLHTAYRRKKVFGNDLFMVNPKSVTIDIRIDKKWNKDLGMYTEVPVNSTFMYVPILETLNVLLQNKSVQSVLLQNSLKNNPDDIFTDFCNGTNFQTNPLFSTKSNALQIQLFYDDFETVNPLGSKTGVHKLGGIYFILRNFPAAINSQLDNIHLVALFHVFDIKKLVLMPF